MFNIFTKSYDSISINDIDDIVGKKNIIDVREPYEFQGGHIKGSKNIPMNILLMDPDNFLNKDDDFYLICHSGGRSGQVARILNSKGFNTKNVSGGFMSYKGNNLA